MVLGGAKLGIYDTISVIATTVGLNEWSGYWCTITRYKDPSGNKYVDVAYCLGVGQIKDAGTWDVSDPNNPTHFYVNHVLLVKNGYGLEIAMQLMDAHSHYLYIRTVANNNPGTWYSTGLLTKVEE